LNQIQKSFADLLERNAETKANRGEVRIFVTEVIQAFSEDAEVAQALETDVKTAADLIQTVGGTVGGEATADQCVRSNAEAVDRSAEDEVTVELVMLAFGSIHAIVQVQSDEAVEEVTNAHAAAKLGVTRVRDERASEDIEVKARTESIAARGWSWGHRSLGIFSGGNRACKNAGSQRCCRKDSDE
jgi:hypothetical protein